MNKRHHPSVPTLTHPTTQRTLRRRRGVTSSPAKQSYLAKLRCVSGLSTTNIPHNIPLPRGIAAIINDNHEGRLLEPNLDGNHSVPLPASTSASDMSCSVRTSGDRWPPERCYVER